MSEGRRPAPVQILAVLLAVLFAAVAHAQGTFEGEYGTEIQGVSMALSLEQAGARLTGTLRVDGSVTTLEGAIVGTTAQGTARNNGGTGHFEVALHEGGLLLALVSDDPGEPPALLALERRAAPASAGNDGAVAQAAPPQLQSEAPPSNSPSARAQDGTLPGSDAAAAVSGRRESRLVGAWRFTQTYVSGTFTAVSETYMTLQADGRCQFGGGRAMAGGADSGSGDVMPCFWKTQGDRIFTRSPEPGSEWRDVARFAFSESGDAVMFYYTGGGRRLWERG